MATSPVDQSAAIYWHEPVTQASISNESPTNTQTAQDAEKARLIKEVAERDKTIQLQAQAIDRVTKGNANLKEQIETEKQENEEMQEQLTRLQQENIQLARTNDQLRQAIIPNAIFPAYPNQDQGALATIRAGGRWFKQHVSFFHAGIGMTGGVLCICFPPFAIPIALFTGATIALLYGISKLF